VDESRVFNGWIDTNGLASADCVGRQAFASLPAEPLPGHLWECARQVLAGNGAALRRTAPRAWFVKMTSDGSWVELSLVLDARGTLPDGPCPVSERSRTLINDLLRRFDRPTVIANKL
jgi:hypothetical protein